MIDQRYIVTCDWCGREEHFSLTNKKGALNGWARRFYLYKLIPLNPLADTIWVHSKNHIDEYLMFCCEDCKEAYFDDTPEDKPHYKIVKG